MLSYAKILNSANKAAHPNRVKYEESPTKRLQAVELLRIFASFGIVAFHAQAPFHDLMYAGLVIFLVISPMLDVQFNWERNRPIGSLTRNLLLPWFFWVAVYGVANYIEHKPIYSERWETLLYGTSVHLWFLPFIFAVLAILNFIKPRFPVTLFWCCAGISTALLLTANLWRPISLTWPLPFPQWLQASPAVFLGVSVGLFNKMGKSRIIAVAMVIVALSLLCAASLPGMTIPYMIGIILSLLAVLFNAKLFPSNLSVQPIASCMLGVYLCHLLILKVVGKLTGSGNYVTVALTFIVAVSAVWLTRKMIPVSRLVLG